MRVQRDIAEARVSTLLPKATPEQEVEMRQIMAGPLYTMEQVMAEVERITQAP